MTDLAPIHAAELLPEYRPAWEIEPGWEIRSEDGTWLRVTAWFEYTSTDPGRDKLIELWLSDVSSCGLRADELIMTRRLG